MSRKILFRLDQFQCISVFVDEQVFDPGTEHLEQFLTAISDIPVNILDLIGGGQVIAGLEMHGTNIGAFVGQPPAGKKVNFGSVRIFRRVDRKIDQSWTDLSRRVRCVNICHPV